MILTSTKEMNGIDQANRLGYRLAGGRVFGLDMLIKYKEYRSVDSYNIHRNHTVSRSEF